MRTRELTFASDWTSERYAGALHEIEHLAQGPGEDLRLGWSGQAPTLWQLAWIAECVRALNESNVMWRWSCSGERDLPFWLHAGGPLDVRPGGNLAG